MSIVVTGRLRFVVVFTGLIIALSPIVDGLIEATVKQAISKQAWRVSPDPSPFTGQANKPLLLCPR